MAYFEIIGVGFDASTDKTDHRVLWVAAASMAKLVECLLGCPVHAISELTEMRGGALALDYTLPDQVEALRAKLLSYTLPEPEQRLVDLLSELLDCQELNLDDMEDHTREVVQRANDYLANTYRR